MRLFEGTEFDRPPRCEVCDELEEDCQCPPPTSPQTPASSQTVRIAVEKRKRGKQVTTVRGVLDEGDHLTELLTVLKNHCGAGGTIQDGVIEIQGQQQDRVRDKLAGMGFRIKK